MKIGFRWKPEDYGELIRIRGLLEAKEIRIGMSADITDNAPDPEIFFTRERLRGCAEDINRVERVLMSEGIQAMIWIDDKTFYDYAATTEDRLEVARQEIERLREERDQARTDLENARKPGFWSFSSWMGWFGHPRTS